MLKPNDILGKTEVDAAAALLIHGITVRIVERDGVALPLTEDFNPKRWDLEVKRGFVTGIRLPTA